MECNDNKRERNINKKIVRTDEAVQQQCYSICLEHEHRPKCIAALALFYHILSNLAAQQQYVSRLWLGFCRDWKRLANDCWDDDIRNCICRKSNLLDFRLHPIGVMGCWIAVRMIYFSLKSLSHFAFDIKFHAYHAQISMQLLYMFVSIFGRTRKYSARFNFSGGLHWSGATSHSSSRHILPNKWYLEVHKVIIIHFVHSTRLCSSNKIPYTAHYFTCRSPLSN